MRYTITYHKVSGHPFTLCHTLEDDSSEYYCDICEEERDPKHWFYYCSNCNYHAHLGCILGKYLNCKFGSAYKFDCHKHSFTLVGATKDNIPCHKCNGSYKKVTKQCTHQKKKKGDITMCPVQFQLQWL
jgi:hypothetical protein